MAEELFSLALDADGKGWTPAGPCGKLVCHDAAAWLCQRNVKHNHAWGEGALSRWDLKQGLGECSHVAEANLIREKKNTWKYLVKQENSPGGKMKMKPCLLLDQLAQLFLLLRTPVPVEGH